MSRITSAVVGLGTISFEHLGRLNRHPAVDLVAVCDLSPTLTRAVAERFGVPAAFVDYARMLEETQPDVVHVLTPPAAHKGLVLQALESGAHVLVEKPITPTWEDYVEVRDAARETGLLLCENYNYRLTEPVVRAGQMVDSGDIGDVVHVDVVFGGVMGPGQFDDRDVPHYAHDLPGGALHNFATHPISVALKFLNGYAGVATHLHRGPGGSLTEDELRVLLSAPSGSATVAVTSHAQPARFSALVEGTRGSIDIDLYKRTARVRRSGSASIETARAGLQDLATAATIIGRALTGRRDHYEGLGRVLDGFYRAVQGLAPPPVSLEEMDDVNAAMRDVFARENRL